ncbi:hypothetical protein BGZ72_001222 [Mortierella alpina]|nr:hypothetical protein BGZ72_001222 [Mortierella alpina]
MNAKVKAPKTKSRQSNQGNQGNSKKNFVSELPPPPAKHSHGERDSANGGCIALSASIWGQGWHQVEPLPASFSTTLLEETINDTAAIPVTAKVKGRAMEAVAMGTTAMVELRTATRTR